jgi:signal transduction histidine kinase/CheY-like chemotaxis protein
MQESKNQKGYLVVETCGPDGRGRVRYADVAASALTGLSAAELVGADAERAAAGLERTVTPLDAEHALWILETAADAKCTEQNRMEQALTKALRDAQAANAAKSAFLSNMSHDIRTPMNAILGMTNIALSHIDEKARVQDCLQKIHSASDHLMSLVNDVLDMSRIDSGRMTINEEPFSLADLLHDIVLLVRPLAAERRHTFHVDVQDIRCERLMGDPLHLRQIYVNLLNNSIKYTPEGGKIELSLSELPGPDVQSITLRFVCRDNGIGMEKKSLDRLFLPFERMQNTTASKIEGTGLGLAITKQLTDLMHGTIQVDTAPGKGSCFTVDIPLPCVAGAEVQPPLPRGQTVLVAESNAAYAAQIAQYLREGGCEPVVVDSGEATVTWLTTAQYEGRMPCALIMGTELSDLPALEVTAHVRQITSRNFPILLVSEQNWGQLEYQATRAGVNAFVPCPLFRSRLWNALSALTQQKTLPAQEAASAQEYRNMHILLVEDNELNQEISAELLSSLGVQVELASDGAEAVRRFTASPVGYYDLIFMDIQMPVMDGYEATRLIRSADRADAQSVWIVAMTANAFLEDIKRSRAAGMNEHCAKPVDIERIEEILRERLDGERSSAP